MIRNLYFSLCLILLTSSAQPISAIVTTSSPTTHCFQEGERLTYRVHYGLVAAGMVNMSVDEALHTINEHTCYKIDVNGESQGLLYVFLKLKNKFISYIDTHQLVPHIFCREIQEGTYSKNEKLVFDHLKQQVQVEEHNASGTKVIKQEIFTTTNNVQDIVSYFYTLRNIDFHKIKAGAMLYSPVFFDNILHPKFATKFLGRKKLKTKFGTVKAIVVAPILPIHASENTIFALPILIGTL